MTQYPCLLPWILAQTPRNVCQGLVFQDASKRVIYEEMNDTELLQAVVPRLPS